MTAPNQCRIVVVLGMHRSGTSLVIRLLNLLGVSLGKEERLMRPVDGDNPTGFWEHLEIVAINTAILDYLGGSWDDLPDFPPRWEFSSGLTGLRMRANELLHQEFSGTRLCGWKDPRICVTLPFWRTVVPDMRYVICLRNPMDVAHSLRARNGIPPERSLELWSRYNRAAIRNSAGQPRMFTFYDRFFEDMDRELDRLARFVGRQVPAPDSDSYGEIVAFVQKKLRHHQSSLLDCIKSPFVQFPEKSLYLAMSIPKVDRGDMTLAEADQLIEEIADGYHSHMSELRELLDRIYLLGDQIRLHEEELAARNARVQELETRTESLIRLHEEELAARNARVQELETRMESLIRLHEEELTARNARVQELEARMESLLNSFSWRLTAPLRAIARYFRELRGRSGGVSSS